MEAYREPRSFALLSHLRMKLQVRQREKTFFGRFFDDLDFSLLTSNLAMLGSKWRNMYVSLRTLTLVFFRVSFLTYFRWGVIEARRVSVSLPLSVNPIHCFILKGFLRGCHSEASEWYKHNAFLGGPFVLAIRFVVGQLIVWAMNTMTSMTHFFIWMSASTERLATLLRVVRNASEFERLRVFF